MSETLKLQLVRCPKCENLLQELPDYSIYQCGGCGAVLRAKKGKLEVNYGSKRFDEERVCGVSDESENLSGKPEIFVGKDAVSRVEDQEDKMSDVEDENSTRNLGSTSDRRETLIEYSSRFSGSGRFDECKSSHRRKHFVRGRFSSSNKFKEDTSSLSFDSSYQNQASRSTRPEIMDHERAELLWKLDELKDKLIRVQTMNRKPPETNLLHLRTDEHHVENGGYFRDHPSSFHRVPSQLSTSNSHVHRYEDPFEPQTFTRPRARRFPSHYNRYMSLEPDPCESHPCSVSLNQPSCSCHQCYTRQFEIPRQIPPSDYNSQRFNHGYNINIVKDYSRRPSKLKAEVGHVPRVRPQRMIFSKEDRCFPIAGGTPFVTCHNCFKLLKLPKKMYIHNKGRWRMSCGACSSLISFSNVDGRLVCMDTYTSRTKIGDLDSSNEVSSGQVSRDNGRFCPEDYANTTYNVLAMDIQHISSSSFQEDITTRKSGEMNNCSVPSSTTYEHEQFKDESPHRRSFDNASEYHAIKQGGKGSLSSRLDERSMRNKSTLRSNSLQEVLQESVNTDDQKRGKKGVDSFLAGIIKKSFRELSRSSKTTGSGKRNVTVNGHLISDPLVKKAEKLAGPIYPGNYWYDYRAGFWGVIGGSCLGIIPSNIQEFNYPMSEKCAGGNTGVVMNGRELHQKDLDLLTSRGLPAGSDKSYIVGISGRVVDAYSGKELVSLGKLAPTVEKLRRGFGMRAPEAAA